MLDAPARFRGVHVVLVMTLGSSLAGSACKDDDEVQRKQRAAVRAEMDTATRELLVRLERDLERSVRAARAARCPRPVLRGEPLPGRAADDIVDILAPRRGTPQRACLAALAAQKGDLVGWTKAAASRREGRVGAGKLPQQARTLVQRCAPAIARARVAARRADGCSPYLVGVRGLDSMLPLVRLARLMVVDAAIRAADGRRREAVQRCLDGLRLAQDLHRGPGAPLIAGMVAKNMGVVVVLQGLRPLLSAGRLSAPERARIDAELAALERSEPPFYQMLVYERHGIALQQILPQIKPKGWKPPGGFDDDVDPQKLRRQAQADPSHARMSGALAWAAMRYAADAMIEVCRPPANQRSCWRGVARVVRRIRRSAKDLTLLGAVGMSLNGTATGLQLRAMLQQAMANVAASRFPRYAVADAERRFLLRAARVQIAVQDHDGCPAAKLLRAAHGALLKDPASGAPMRFERRTEGSGFAYMLRPAPPEPDKGDRADEDYFRASYRFACPATRSRSRDR